MINPKAYTNYFQRSLLKLNDKEMGIGTLPKSVFQHKALAKSHCKKCALSHPTGLTHKLITDKCTLMLSERVYPIPPALCHSNIF